MRILIVEDDPTLAELLVRVLAEDGHEPVLTITAAAGLRAAAASVHDVVVLDWMLPDGDGPSFCASLRAVGTYTPVLMLTARGAVEDRVTGLRAGADDYLVKPFDVDELMARLEALVRRGEQLGHLALGDLVLDRLHKRGLLRGAPLELTTREYELLLRLANDVGTVVSRATLLADVWMTANDPGTGVLDVHVSRLRDKLGDDAWRIETVRGAGYRLKGER